MNRRELLAAPLLAIAACSRDQSKRVAVIPKGTSHSFWVTVHAGAAAAGKQFGFEILWNGPAVETDISRQIQIIDSMIAQRVDGIVIAACDRNSLIAPVNRAVAAGIPVTVFDSGLDTDTYMSYVATDNLDAGRLAARTLGPLLNGKGKAAMIMNIPGSVSTTEREKGFDEVIASTYPDIQIVQRQFGMSDPAKGLSVAENILNAHPDLAGFFCSNQPGSNGAAKAIRDRRAIGKIKLVGFDSDDTLVQDIRDGVVQALIVQDPFKMGFEAVKTIADKLAGKQPPKRLDLAAVAVTASNLDTPEMQALVAPDVRKYLEQ